MAHHFRKVVTVGKAPELNDLSQAGFAEFARQWLLVNRQAAYDGTGIHKLFVTIGGSIGHGGLYDVEIDEGEFPNRIWGVTLSDIDPAAQKKEAAQEKEEFKKSRVRTCLVEHPDGLSQRDIPTQKIPVRFEHKSFQGVGHTEKIVIVSTDVLADGIISRDTSWARDVATSGKQGFPWQASMGGPIHELQYVKPGETVTVNGQTFEGKIYVIRKMTLKEISFVDLGADENTTAVITSQFNEQKGFTMTNTTPQQTEPVDIEQAWLVDRRRIAAIEKFGGGKLPDLEAQAIEEGWAVEKFRGEFQHRTMPDASVIAGPGTRNQVDGHKIVEASFLQATAVAVACGNIACRSSPTRVA